MSETTQGIVKSADKETIVFAPAGTTYQLHLQTNAALSAGTPARGTIRVKGRKVWTIPAGGSFISPLIGSPRVVQGKVKAIDGNRIAVQAGTLLWVELPADQTAFDLKNGPVVPGVMVNITTYPGAAFDAA